MESLEFGGKFLGTKHSHRYSSSQTKLYSATSNCPSLPIFPPHPYAESDFRVGERGVYYEHSKVSDMQLRARAGLGAEADVPGLAEEQGPLPVAARHGDLCRRRFGGSARAANGVAAL